MCKWRSAIVRRTQTSINIYTRNGWCHWSASSWVSWSAETSHMTWTRVRLRSQVWWLETRLNKIINDVPLDSDCSSTDWWLNSLINFIHLIKTFISMITVPPAANQVRATCDDGEFDALKSPPVLFQGRLIKKWLILCLRHLLLQVKWHLFRYAFEDRSCESGAAGLNFINTMVRFVLEMFHKTHIKRC